MKLMKHPYVNAAITASISLLYGVIFFVTSGHLELERMLQHAPTLNHGFWNGWSAFIGRGCLKYIGCAYILAALCVVVLSFIRRADYDEYQAGILSVSFIITGILMVLLFPAALVLTLSDPNYAIETTLFLVVAHWSIFLAVNLAYTAKWCVT